MTTWCSLEEAVAKAQSGDRVFVQGACSTPSPLLQALVARGEALHDVEITHLHTYGPTPYTDARWEGALSPARSSSAPIHASANTRERQYTRRGELRARQRRCDLPRGYSRALRPAKTACRSMSPFFRSRRPLRTATARWVHRWT
jgi:hypothetical protein